MSSIGATDGVCVPVLSAYLPNFLGPEFIRSHSHLPSLKHNTHRRHAVRAALDGHAHGRPLGREPLQRRYVTHRSIYRRFRVPSLGKGFLPLSRDPSSVYACTHPPTPTHPPTHTHALVCVYPQRSGLYDIHIRLKGYPVLEPDMPPAARKHMTAAQVCVRKKERTSHYTHVRCVTRLSQCVTICHTHVLHVTHTYTHINRSCPLPPPPSGASSASAPSTTPFSTASTTASPS